MRTRPPRIELGVGGKSALSGGVPLPSGDVHGVGGALAVLREWVELVLLVYFKGHYPPNSNKNKGSEKCYWRNVNDV